jgi:hypothetical protein
MNQRIEELEGMIAACAAEESGIKAMLQVEYNKVFDDSKALTKAISDAQSSSEYQTDRYGEIQSWFRFSGLSDYAHCREYFETWLYETHCMDVDWDSDCFLMNQGESLIIQDDSRHKHDNGVWLNSKQVVSESDYTDEDGNVDTEKRNRLIEEYMEQTGYFPGVFRCDQYGNVFHVNTQAKE